MKSSTMKSFYRIRIILLLAVLLFVALAIAPRPLPSPVSAQTDQTYILTASRWSGAQTAAVTSAGGTLTFSHGRSGIGIATSSSPTFLDHALASGVFSGGAADQSIQWLAPREQSGFGEIVVTPGDEPFINLQWNIQAIEAPTAWAAGFTGQGVRVAILDGGIHSTHVDLDANIDVAASKSFVPGFAFNQDTGTFWHGTFVAGIVAAEDNGIGTIGVAPQATIIGVKVLHGGGGLVSAIIQGILYAATPLSEGGAGAHIINMSFGSLIPIGGNTGAGLAVAALNKAVNFAARSTLAVSGAGNNGVDLDHSESYIFTPAQSGSGIAVSATGPLGYALGATNFRRPASYTNYGNSAIWVAAPGGDFVLPGTAFCTLPVVPSSSITAPCFWFDAIVSSARGSGASNASFSFAAGTSFSAPAASGVAALIKQRFPNISVGALKNYLANTADDEGKVGNDPHYGKGFINARRAVTE